MLPGLRPPFLKRSDTDLLQQGKEIAQANMMLTLLKCYILRILRAVSSKDDVSAPVVLPPLLFLSIQKIFYFPMVFLLTKSFFFRGILNSFDFFPFPIRSLSFCVSFGLCSIVNCDMKTVPSMSCLIALKQQIYEKELMKDILNP